MIYIICQKQQIIQKMYHSFRNEDYWQSCTQEYDLILDCNETTLIITLNTSTAYFMISFRNTQPQAFRPFFGQVRDIYNEIQKPSSCSIDHKNGILLFHDNDEQVEMPLQKIQQDNPLMAELTIRRLRQKQSYTQKKYFQRFSQIEQKVGVINKLEVQQRKRDQFLRKITEKLFKIQERVAESECKFAGKIDELNKKTNQAHNPLEEQLLKKVEELTAMSEKFELKRQQLEKKVNDSLKQNQSIWKEELNNQKNILEQQKEELLKKKQQSRRFHLQLEGDREKMQNKIEKITTLFQNHKVEMQQSIKNLDFSEQENKIKEQLKKQMEIMEERLSIQIKSLNQEIVTLVTEYQKEEIKEPENLLSQKQEKRIKTELKKQVEVLIEQRLNTKINSLNHEIASLFAKENENQIKPFQQSQKRIRAELKKQMEILEKKFNIRLKSQIEIVDTLNNQIVLLHKKVNQLSIQPPQINHYLKEEKDMMESKMERISAVRKSNNAFKQVVIDKSTPCIDNFKISGNKITLKQETCKYIIGKGNIFENQQILLDLPIPKNVETFVFHVHIAEIKEGCLMIGIVDRKIQKGKKSSFKSGNAICYDGETGGIFFGENGQAQSLSTSDKFMRDMVVSVLVQIAQFKVSFTLTSEKGSRTHQIFSQILANPQTQFVPYFELANAGDCVEYFVQ